MRTGASVTVRVSCARAARRRRKSAAPAPALEPVEDQVERELELEAPIASRRCHVQLPVLGEVGVLRAHLGDQPRRPFADIIARRRHYPCSRGVPDLIINNAAVINNIAPAHWTWQGQTHSRFDVEGVHGDEFKTKSPRMAIRDNVATTGTI